MIKTIKYVTGELTFDAADVSKRVGDAIIDLYQEYCHVSDLKILISPMVSKLIEVNHCDLFGTVLTGKMTLWFGVEVDDEYPFNDHILIFHKTLAAHRPELVRRIEL